MYEMLLKDLISFLLTVKFIRSIVSEDIVTDYIIENVQVMSVNISINIQLVLLDYGEYAMVQFKMLEIIKISNYLLVDGLVVMIGAWVL